MKSVDWVPSTIDECIEGLNQLLSPEEQISLIKMSEKELVLCHHGLGRWIRNNWGLWSGGPLQDHMKSLGFHHPDDMSTSIIREWWNRMNNRPSCLQEDIEDYARYWEKQKP